MPFLLWHIGDENIKVPYGSSEIDNDCLDLLQKHQESYHNKQALVSRLCSCQIEHQGWNSEQYKLAFDCQLKDSGPGGVSCNFNASNECKASTIDYYMTGKKIATDPKLKKCINLDFIRDSRIHMNGLFELIRWKERLDTKRRTSEYFIKQILTTCKF